MSHNVGFTIHDFDAQLPVVSRDADEDGVLVTVTKHFFLDVIEMGSVTRADEPDRVTLGVLTLNNLDRDDLSPMQLKGLRILLGAKLYKAHMKGEELIFSNVDKRYIKRVIEADIYQS